MATTYTTKTAALKATTADIRKLTAKEITTDTLFVDDASGKSKNILDLISNVDGSAVKTISVDNEATHISLEATRENGAVTLTLGETDIASADALSKLTTRVGTAESDIDNLQTAVGTLNGNDTTAGSVKKALADAKAYTDAEIDKVEAAANTLAGRVTTAEGEIDALQTAVNALESGKLTYQVVDTLPAAADATLNVIYLVPDTTIGAYVEYLCCTKDGANHLERIGTTAAELGNYATWYKNGNATTYAKDSGTTNLVKATVTSGVTNAVTKVEIDDNALDSKLSDMVTATTKAQTDATNAANAAVQALTDAKKYTDGEIDKVEAAANTLAGRVTTAEDNITTLTGKMTTAEGEIDALQSDMATAKNNISTLQTKTALPDAYTTVQSYVEAKVKAAQDAATLTGGTNVAIENNVISVATDDTYSSVSDAPISGVGVSKAIESISKAETKSNGITYSQSKGVVTITAAPAGTGFGTVKLSDATNGTANAAEGQTAATPKAVSDALGLAKSDATTKATTAKSEAIAAAASDATTKATTAKSEAIAAAASDATTKADAAEAAAISAAKSYTDTLEAKVVKSISGASSTDGKVTVSAGSKGTDGSVALSVSTSDIASAKTLKDHTDNTTVHITADERTKWDGAVQTVNGDTTGNSYIDISTSKSGTTVNLTVDESKLSDELEAIKEDIATITGTSSGTGTSLTSINTRLTAAEGEIDTLQNEMDAVEGVAATAVQSVTGDEGNTYVDVKASKSGTTVTLTVNETKLSTELNTKATTTALTTHTGDKTVHITAAERTKWNAVTNKASQSDLTALTTRVTTAEGDIDALDTRVTTAEGNITTLQGDMTTAKGNITTLEGKMETAESEIDTLQNTVKSLTTSSLTYKVVTALPTGDALVENTIYLIAESGVESGTYVEYLCYKNASGVKTTEKIGTTATDLSEYAKTQTAADVASSGSTLVGVTVNSGVANAVKSVTVNTSGLTTELAKYTKTSTLSSESKSGGGITINQSGGNVTSVSVAAGSVAANNASVVTGGTVYTAIAALSADGGAIKALDTRVTTAEGEIDTLQGDMTTAEGEIDTLQSAVNTLQGAATVAGSVAEAKKAGTDAQAAVDALEALVGTNSVSSQISTAINGLDATIQDSTKAITITQTDGELASVSLAIGSGTAQTKNGISITQATNGKVTLGVTADTTPTDNSTNFVTSDGVHAAIEAAKTAAGTDAQNKINNLNKASHGAAGVTASQSKGIVTLSVTPATVSTAGAITENASNVVTATDAQKIATAAASAAVNDLDKDAHGGNGVSLKQENGIVTLTVSAGEVASNNASFVTGGAVNTAITNAINNLDATIDSSGVTGIKLTQTNGKVATIAVTAGTVANGGTAAVTAGGVKTYVDTAAAKATTKVANSDTNATSLGYCRVSSSTGSDGSTTYTVDNDPRITVTKTQLGTPSAVEGDVITGGAVKFVDWSKVEVATGAFASNASLTAFHADLSRLTTGTNMFKDCTNLTSFCGNLGSLTNGTDMFAGCRLDLESVIYIVDSLPVIPANSGQITIGVDAKLVSADNINALAAELSSKGWGGSVTAA